MDLEAVRTFIAAAEAGRFQDAATDLAVTQQAVSKRIAALEKELGGAAVHPDRARRPAHHRRPGVPAACQGPDTGRGEGDRLGASGAARAAGGRHRHAERACRRCCAGSTRRARRSTSTSSRCSTSTRRWPRWSPARSTRRSASSRPDAACRPASRPSAILDERLDLLVGPRHPLAAARTVTARAAGRAPHLDPGDRSRRRVGRLLRRARLRVRALHRRYRAALRQRPPHGRGRRIRRRRLASSARNPAWPGRTATTCGASRWSTRRRCTRTRSCGARRTRIPRWGCCGASGGCGRRATGAAGSWTPAGA